MRATIVIATINREKELLKVLSDLTKQTCQDFEVYISSEKGIVNVMNKALAQCKNEVIIRIDDDMQVPERWLEEVLWTFKAYPECGGVTGPTIVLKSLRENRDVFRWETLPQPFKWIYVHYFQEGNPLRPAHMNRCGAFSLGSNYEQTLFLKDVFPCDTLESCNYAVRTSLVKRLGGWDERFGGVNEYFEQDMAWKIRKLGYKTLYNPKAYLFHLVSKGGNYGARKDCFSRLSNFIRFYMRHLFRVKDIPRFVSYLLFQIGYYVFTTTVSLSKHRTVHG